jgi:hypothetical protein
MDELWSDDDFDIATLYCLGSRVYNLSGTTSLLTL